MQNNLFKTSYEILKKNFFLFLLFDTLFIVTSVYFLAASRGILQSFILRLHEYSPQLDLLQQTQEINQVQLDSLLGNINSIANQAQIFIYFVIPIVLFLLWVIFQGSSWQLIHGKKKFDLNYLKNFAIITIPLWFLITLSGAKLLLSFSETLIPTGESVEGSFFGILVVFVLLLYFLFTLYPRVKDGLNSFKVSLAVAIKKFYKLFFYFLPLLVSMIVLSILITYLFILVVANLYPNLISLIILLILAWIAFAYYRIVYALVVNK